MGNTPTDWATSAGRPPPSSRDGTRAGVSHRGSPHGTRFHPPDVPSEPCPCALSYEPPVSVARPHRSPEQEGGMARTSQLTKETTHLQIPHGSLSFPRPQVGFRWVGGHAAPLSAQKHDSLERKLSLMKNEE